MHSLTNQARYELDVEVQYFDRNWKHAVYGSFKIGNENEKYRIELGSYNESSTTIDALSIFSGTSFTTFDFGDANSNFGSKDYSCVNSIGSGWWYYDCGETRLTGQALPGNPFERLISWDDIPISAAIMKMRRL